MSTCSRCGASFSCGMVDAVDAPCWCTQLPKLPRDAIDSGREPGAVSCLCPTCLKERIEQARAGQQQTTRD